MFDAAIFGPPVYVVGNAGVSRVHPCHPEPCEGSLLKYRQDLNRDPSTSLRSAQDDKERESRLLIIPLRAQKPRFLQAPPNCRKLTAQFGKSECGALIIESIWRAPQREKRMQSRALPRRTFGCLSNHGKKFCLFQNFFREYHAAPLREICVKGALCPSNFSPLRGTLKN